MDLQIGFFLDISSREVLARYLHSHFIFQPNAVNLCNEISIATKNLDPAKILMIGIYGPNMNWFIFDRVNGEQEKDNYSPLYNIGSCELYSIHGAFETGMLAC